MGLMERTGRLPLILTNPRAGRQILENLTQLTEPELYAIPAFGRQEVEGSVVEDQAQGHNGFETSLVSKKTRQF